MKISTKDLIKHLNKFTEIDVDTYGMTYYTGTHEASFDKYSIEFKVVVARSLIGTIIPYNMRDPIEYDQEKEVSIHEPVLYIGHDLVSLTLDQEKIFEQVIKPKLYVR